MKKMRILEAVLAVSIILNMFLAIYCCSLLDEIKTQDELIFELVCNNQD